MQCNHCRLQIILAEAKRTDSRVVTRSSHWGENGSCGTDVFLVPKGEKLGKYKGPTAKNPEGDKEFKKYHKYHRAWMDEIPYHCICEE